MIHFYDDIDVWELYDLANDPKEMKNLINDESMGEVIAQLKVKLSELQEKYNDPIRLNK